MGEEPEETRAEAPPVDEAPEEDEEPAEAEGETKKKKSKNKRKKRAAAAAAAAAAVAVENDAAIGGLYVPRAGGTDVEFAAWLDQVAAAHPPPEVENPLALPRNFMGYSFTGKQKPAHVCPKLPPPTKAVPDYALHSEGVSMCERNRPKEIPVHEGEELATMREACRLGREILDLCARALKPGVTGDFLDRVVYHACVERDVYPSPLNYFRFPKSVCVSPNEVICHGIPDMRPIEEGEIVNLDVSIFYKGFHSDLNETYFVGKCEEDKVRVVRAAYEALSAASSMIKPGTLYRDLGAAITSAASRNGCSVVSTYTGHGVGRLFHGPPNVPHYKKNKAVGIMKPGHIFTVEPMINLGGNGGDRTWPDNWTAVTKDGKPSAQFEHTFLVTETGMEVLTARPGDPKDCLAPFNPANFGR